MTLPEKTIERLSGYRRILLDCLAKGKTHVYSHELAALNHITAVQVRRDMMLMGFSSMQRKGYGVKELIDAIGVLIDTKKGIAQNFQRPLGSFQKRRRRIVFKIDGDDEYFLPVERPHAPAIILVSIDIGKIGKRLLFAIAV